MAVGDVLRKETIVAATPEQLWPMWTSAEGLSWISSNSRVDPVPGGDYAWFLDIVDERGVRGSEGSKLISLTPPTELVFSWGFPPPVPTLRWSGATTTVTVRFEPVTTTTSRVTLTAVGWRDGEDWEAGYLYFDQAWSAVFERLRATVGTAGV